MVTARARKKLPVTPVTEMSGRKTTTGVMVEKTSGVGDLGRAVRTASMRVSPRSRWTTMFSTTTMASSMTRPMAAARPPRVMRLKLWPMAQRKRMVMATVTGMTRPATREEVQSREEEEEDDAGEDEADEDGVADAGDGSRGRARTGRRRERV